MYIIAAASKGEHARTTPATSGARKKAIVIPVISIPTPWNTMKLGPSIPFDMSSNASTIFGASICGLAMSNQPTSCLSTL